MLVQAYVTVTRKRERRVPVKTRDYWVCGVDDEALAWVVRGKEGKLG